jgi:hypothetical protein
MFFFFHLYITTCENQTQKLCFFTLFLNLIVAAIVFVTYLHIHIEIKVGYVYIGLQHY